MFVVVAAACTRTLLLKNALRFFVELDTITRSIILGTVKFCSVRYLVFTVLCKCALMSTMSLFCTGLHFCNGLWFVVYLVLLIVGVPCVLLALCVFSYFFCWYQRDNSRLSSFVVVFVRQGGVLFP